MRFCRRSSKKMVLFGGMKLAQLHCLNLKYSHHEPHPKAKPVALLRSEISCVAGGVWRGELELKHLL